MRILLLSLALIPASAAARDPVPSPADPGTFRVVPVMTGKPVCQNARNQMVRPMERNPYGTRLGDQPQAKAYRTVLHLRGGCDLPVVINEEVGEQR